MDDLIISIKQLNDYVFDRLDEDFFLEEIWVKGEITDLGVVNNNAFFTLKDEYASVECAFFGIENYEDFLIEGQSVFIKGSPNIYKKNARFKFTVREIQLEGAGELYLQFEKTKLELEKMGVFDIENKKELPKYPKTIGIVTSKNGSVLHDIKNIAARRNPSVSLKLYPVKVQGEDAHLEVSYAIDYFNKQKNVDIIIVARGGGSLEDLFAFNTKEVALSVHKSKIPIISAVGHETDFTLCDFASDLRAPTPSAAAELAIIPATDILQNIEYLTISFREKLLQLVQTKQKNVNYALSELNSKIFYAKITQNKEKIKYLELEIYSKAKKLYKNMQMRYNVSNAKIEILSPYNAFERGYAIALSNNKAIKSIKDVKINDNLDIILKDGIINAKVNNINGEVN